MTRTQIGAILIWVLSALTWSSGSSAQDCTAPTSTQPVDVAVSSTPVGQFPCVAMQPGCGRFVIAWQDIANPFVDAQYDVRFLRFAADGTAMPYSGGLNGTPISTFGQDCANQTDESTTNAAISIALGRGGATS
ncbi:MAG: hypothetical protein U1A27_02140 [Phycisphaerae bacterium]